MTRTESAETPDHVSCQDMDVDDSKSLEKLGFVPRAVDEPLRVKHMCDKKCNEKSFKFSWACSHRGGRGRHAAHDQPLQGVL